MGRQQTASRIVAPALGVVLTLSMVSGASAGQRGTTKGDHPTSGVALVAESGRLKGVAATHGVAWAVGESGDGSDSKALTLHWNGTRWQREANPSPPGAELSAVSATSPTNVWAVGTVGIEPNPTKTLILHWNGKKWVKSPGIPGSLSTVAATSPTNVWAVGGTHDGAALILHWNGRAWRQTPSPAGYLTAVAATSPSNAWAVGGTTGGNQATLILHWNGKAWQQTPSPSVGGDQGLGSILLGVEASPDRTALAVGDGNDCGCGPGTPLVERWNGHTWGEDSTSQQDSIDLSGVAAVPTGRAWAVGEAGSGDGPTNGVILERNGSAWRSVSVPGLQSQVGGLSGVAATSRSNAWAVGWESPVTVASSNAAGPGDRGTPEILILHWNGSAWTPQTILRPAKTPAAAVATTTTTTLTPTTTTSSTTTTNVAPSTSPTSVASGFTQWSGAWGAHEQQLEISPTGDGTLTYQDLTACTNCSFASAPTATMEFTLTSVNGGTASGNVTASSDSTNYAVGQEVMVSLAAGSPGQLLELSVAGQGPATYCNSTSAGQCGA